MSLDRTPAHDAIRKAMREYQTNAIAKGYVWMLLNVALDAIEEQLAQDTAHTGDYWVVEYAAPNGRRGIVSVQTTRHRARVIVKRLRATYDDNRKAYIIHRIRKEPNDGK